MSFKTTAYQSDEVHIYYNIEMTNNQDKPIPLSFTDYRNQPLFSDHPEDYQMAITRFQIPCSSLPWTFFPSVNDDGITPDNAYYRVSIPYKNAWYTAYVTFVPQGGLPNTDINYLGIYSIQSLVDMINQAILTAFNLVVAAYPADFPTLECAYLLYDSANGFINYIAPTVNFNSAMLRVYFDTTLYLLFDNLFSYYYPDGVVSGTLNADANYWLIAKNTGNNVITSAPPFGFGPASSSYEMKAEFKNLGQLSSAKSIVFTSANLPVSGEFIPTSSFNTSLNTSSSFRNILTDFELLLDSPNGQGLRSIQQFYNSGEYRLIDLSGTTGIKVVDLQAYYSDSKLRLRPIMLPVNSYCSVKILFRRKSFKGGL